MLNRQEGLTATYNRFHNPDEHSTDIQMLRDLHRQMDEAVALAYGWGDLDLGHDFHDTAQGVRYTISEPARREVLRRLLALNFERHEEEVRLGLGTGGKKGKKRQPPSSPQPPSPSGRRGGGSSGADDAGSGEDGSPLPQGEGLGVRDDDLPPEQASFLDDDLPRQPRLL
ncbi:MAG: hypothetical protein IPK19_41455 [Chloroflexi bacterium]|nr:hypothetical protein [Chloroflexota bacterium]